MRRATCASLLLLIPAFALLAQDNHSNTPLVGTSSAPETEVFSSPSLRFQLDRPSPVQFDALTAEAKKPKVEGRLRSVGLSRQLAPRTLQRGEWSSRSGNRRVWRLLLQTAEAKIVRVHFLNFHVGDGAVYVTNPDNLTQTFRFTKDGPFGDGEFWSPLIHANSAMVEWETDNTGAATQPPFEIDTINQTLALSPQVAPGDYSCYIDYACSTYTTGSAMAQLSFIHNGLSYVCSGTLVNPRLSDASLAPKPLLLTANHCVSDDVTARTVIAVQNDWYTTCGGTERAPTYQVRAQQLLAHTPIGSGDHSLILLGDFPAGSSWVLMGWSTADFSVGATVGGLHHPDGLPLKISNGNRISDATVTVTDLGVAPGSEYYRVNWTAGASGGGSSGSGLFESGYLRGTLTYGNGQVDGSQCGSLSGYGRLGSGYSALQPWFETAAGGEVISKISAPTPSGTLTSAAATFTWNASPDATEYVIYVGSSAGSYNLGYKNNGLSTSVTLAGMPTNGSTVYVRLYTHLSIGWYNFDYTYKAVTIGTGTPILTSVFPSGLPALSAQSTISISGSGFVQGSVVSFGLPGVAPTSLTTTYVSATSLSAIIPASLLTTAGTAQIYVINPTGTSSPVSFAIIAPAGPTYTSSVSIPHFAAGGPLISGFYVLNSSSATGQFQFSFYDDNGKLLAVPITGVGTVSQLADTIPANGAKYYEVGTNAAAIYSGSAQFRTTTPAVTVQELFRNHAPDNNYYEASIPSTTGSFGFIVPFDATKFGTTQIYTGFAIANLDATNPAKVTCIARNAAGGLVANALTVPQLSPLGHWADYQFPAISGLRGTFDCTSTTKIAPVALRFLGTNSLSSLPVTLK